jgi:imidazolonepropionase-like amidohydrolase
MRYLAILIAFAWSIACGSQRAARVAAPHTDLVVRAARVLDVRTGRYSGPTALLVAGTRITGLLPAARFDARNALRVIDVGEMTVVPGLIDGHVHLAIGGPVRANALADLRAGFTTVADQGALTHRLLALKDSINDGHIEGPRVLAAGIWVGSKGGVCEFTGIGITGGADAFVQRVQQNIAAGANLTKVCLSPWPRASFATPDTVEISSVVLRSIVNVSHAANRPVTAHAISRGAALAALDADVDGLVHVAYVDAALATAMRAKGMWMIPTIASLTAGDTSAASRALVSALRVAHDAHVTMVFGTDGGVLPHGKGVDEMEALVAAGLSPLEVIQAATVNAAKALAIGDSVGQIGVGMTADFVAVRGDPLRDISALRNIGLVVSRGRVAVQPPQ